MSTCKHGSTAPDHILREIHESQAGIREGVYIWRHKCCVCAFTRGEELGRTQAKPPNGNCECKATGRRAPEEILDALPISQAGSSGLGRHQCAICAFHAGVAASRNQASKNSGPYKGFGDGTKKYQKRAQEPLPILVAQAKARNTINYGQLAVELNMPNPRNLNRVLGAIGSELNILGRHWREHIPPLTCLVIAKHDKTPRRGIGFHMSVEKFKKLSHAGQQGVLHDLHREIWNYPRWDKVLHHFRLEPLVPAKSKALQKIARKAQYGKAGGETEDHRRLKEYVKTNPRLVGIRKPLTRETEYKFLSSDAIDVLFKCSLTWVGVEVKGARSDTDDIMRGIFQCLKYKALIEATQRYEQLELDSRVILVLGGKLPVDLRSTIGILDIELKEQVKVPTSFRPSGKS